MRHEDRPGTIPESVRAASFPVYGLIDHPLDLSVSSHGLGISHVGNLVHISFDFTSPQYSEPFHRYTPKVKNFEILSIDVAGLEPAQVESIIIDIGEPAEGQVFNDKAERLFQKYHFSEEEQKQAGSPSAWIGTLSLATTVFSGKMFYWKSPLHVSSFFLQSEKTILTGSACGLLFEEVRHLLEGLQVINDQEDLLRQYQHEFENP